MTNIANAALQLGEESQMRAVNQQIFDFVKKNKNQYARELLLNHSLLNLQLKEYKFVLIRLKIAKELIIRFENLVKVENE